MRLSRRLLMLILLCLLPMVAAGLITLVALYQQRQTQLAELVRREVDLGEADMLNSLEGSRALLLGVAEIPSRPDCGTRLSALQRSLPEYRFLAIIETADPGGSPERIACASGGDLPMPPAMRQGWLGELPTNGGFHVGAYTAPPGAGGAFLPVGMRLPGAAGSAGRMVVAGIDLRWLGQHLSEMRLLDAALVPRGALTVTDRAGVILAHVPDGDRWVGTRVGAETLAHLREADSRTAMLPGVDGRVRLVAFAPAAGLPDGLSVAAGVDPRAFLADVKGALIRGAVLGGVASAIALIIAAVAARRFVHLPASRLLDAARRWTGGDLSARADMRADASEFGYLGEAFNRMAADIEARVAAHAEQARLLETRVAERTRELSESNNRLQVEIAERQRAETVMHQAQKLQAVGQLAGGVAHDFNNLLATILGSLELIERRVTDGDDKLRALLTRAMDAVQRGAQLTSRLLAFSRRQRLAARPTDLNRLVADLVTLAGSTLGRRVRVETHLAPDLWPAMADTSQVEAAILNLALNARDAMPHGGVLILATGNETVAEGDADGEPGDYVRVSVEDTGAGMSREILARAFEPFFTTKELGKGSGLGLSQVYGLARQSGGTVRIRSEPGAGTAVSLLLPRAPEAALARAELPRSARSSRDATAGLVLLVDDDADVRQVSVDMLRDLGYEVVEAADGEEAIEIVRRMPVSPALLVLDYAMPGMNGLRLAAALRCLGITAPLLLATGYAELSDDKSGVKPDAILHKPFSLAELDRTLTQLRARAPETA